MCPFLHLASPTAPCPEQGPDALKCCNPPGAGKKQYVGGGGGWGGAGGGAVRVQMPRTMQERGRPWSVTWSSPNCWLLILLLLEKKIKPSIYSFQRQGFLLFCKQKHFKLKESNVLYSL